MSELTSKQIQDFEREVFDFNKREEMRVRIFLSGLVSCLTWAPLCNLHSAGFELGPTGYRMNPADIPRAAAVLRLQGYEVKIEEG